jgi:hypothetical protein
VRAAASDALRHAFDSGFGAAAWRAAGVALCARLPTRALLTAPAARAMPAGTAALHAPA